MKGVSRIRMLSRLFWCAVIVVYVLSVALFAQERAGRRIPPLPRRAGSARQRRGGHGSQRLCNTDTNRRGASEKAI